MGAGTATCAPLLLMLTQTCFVVSRELMGARNDFRMCHCNQAIKAGVSNRSTDYKCCGTDPKDISANGTSVATHRYS